MNGLGYRSPIRSILRSFVLRQAQDERISGQAASRRQKKAVVASNDFDRGRNRSPSADCKYANILMLLSHTPQIANAVIEARQYSILFLSFPRKRESISLNQYKKILDSRLKHSGMTMQVERKRWKESYISGHSPPAAIADPIYPLWRRGNTTSLSFNSFSPSGEKVRMRGYLKL
jgi:hypothetical protein